MKVIFNANYNGVILETEDLAVEDAITEACSQFYDEDGEYIGSESEVTAAIASVVGEVEVEFDYVSS